MKPASLRFTAKTVIARTLACRQTENPERIVCLEALRNAGADVLSEEILTLICKSFPQELTDELLCLLTPQHLKHLCLIKCKSLTPEGFCKSLKKCCQNLQALDFKSCNHLLHPVVFNCLRESVINLSSVTFEDCDLINDDIVQVLLLCCHHLKHINLSCCKNITDKVFMINNGCQANSGEDDCCQPKSSHNSFQAGKNLTSVDISGCRSLTSLGIYNLVTLCGSSLHSVSFAWTNIGCIALLFLAGLDPSSVESFVKDTDLDCAKLLQVEDDVKESSPSKETHEVELKPSENTAELFPQVPSLSDIIKNQYGNSDNLRTLEVDGEQTHASCISPAKPYEIFADAVSSERTLSLEEDCENLENECSKVLEMINLLESPVGNSICSFQNAVEDLASALNKLHDYSRCEEDLGTEGNCEHSSALINLGLNESYLSEVSTLGNGTGNCDDGNSSTQIKLSERNEPNFIANPSRSQQEKAIVDHYGQSSDLKDNYPIKDHSSPEKVVSCDVIRRETVDEECTLYTKDNFQEVVSVRTNMNCSSYGPKTEGDKVISEIFQFSSESKDKCALSYDDVTLSPHMGGVDNSGDNRDLRQKNHVTSSDSSDFKDVKISKKCEFEDSQAALSSFDLKSDTYCALSPTCSSERKWEQIFGHSEQVSSVSMNFKLNEKQDSEDFDLCKQKGDSPSTYKSKETSKDFAKEVPCGLLQGSSLDERLDIQNVNKYTNMNDTKVYVQETSENKNREHSIGGHSCNAGDSVCGEKVVSEIDIPKVESASDDSLQTPNNASNDIDETSFELEKIPTCLKDKQIHENKKHSQETTIKEKATSGQIYTPNITSLDISCISFHSKTLDSACLKLFSKSNPRLRDFSISWSQLDDDTLIYVLKNEPELQELSLVDCESLSDRSLFPLATACPSLTTLNLKGSCYFTDHGFKSLCSLKDLKSLCLAESLVTDHALDSIVTIHGHQLTNLDLCWCEDLTDVGMSTIASSCPKLNYLGLRQCSAKSSTFGLLATNCQYIKSLNIAGVERLSDNQLVVLAKNLVNLVEVDLSWNSCLSDVGIRQLLLHCTKLEEAILSGLKFITSKPFLPIIGKLATWRFKQEVFSLRKRRSEQRGVAGGNNLLPCDTETAKKLEDDIPYRSLSYAPHLRHLTLEYSDKVNDDHLAQIVAVCRGTLYVSDYYAQPVEPRWFYSHET